MLNQPRRATDTTDPTVPVGDALLSRLYRAKPSEVAGIVAPLSADVRAQLAVFCYSRAHLREIGREVAAACDEASLRQHAGHVLGAALIAASRAPMVDRYGADPQRPGRPKVTLATASDMKRRVMVEDDGDAE